MILLANSEAWPGFRQTVELLKNNAYGMDAMVAGISEVEREAEGAQRRLWRLAEHARQDGMRCWRDGRHTREVGSVGAVPDTLPVAALAHEVMKRCHMSC